MVLVDGHPRLLPRFPSPVHPSSRSRPSMRALPAFLLLSTLFLPLKVLAAKYDERFTESLKLTTLRDGRVLASFAFETVRKGALPQDPRRLGGVDDGMYLIS
jgi:hypothetical protein